MRRTQTRWWVTALLGSMMLCLLGGTVNESVARQTRQAKPAVSVKKSKPSLARPARRGTPRVYRGARVSPQPAKEFESLLLEDAETGRILLAENSDKPWPAASLTKMMVALLALEEIECGRLSWQTPVVISSRASLAGGRAINLRAGEVFPLEELLQAMLVTSANDASIAVAERLKGSVAACVLDMNKRARELGMAQTRFRTPNGLPLTDGTPPDVSSAADMAALGRALAKHHRVLAWTALSRIPFRDGRVLLPNTNRLVGKVMGVDGLKTGFTNKARYNLVTTAQRDNLRLIAVVLGARSSRTRFQVAASLLDWGFTHFTRVQAVKGGEPVEAQVRVENGSVSTLRPVAATDVSFVVPKDGTEGLRVSVQLPAVVAAPVFRYQRLGQVVVRDQNGILAVIPALSPGDVPRARWFPARR
jgi:D-alanyl-D-alanine carboxypeptidase (penicillin-binding protein 5/6)